MAIAAVLFDLDGTLVDSERESAEAMARALRKHQGIEITQEDRDFIVGRSWREIHPRMQQHYPGLTWSMDELIAHTAEERAHVIAEAGLTILPGAREAVERFRHRYPIALVTGSSRREAKQALDVLGAPDAFPVMVCSEDTDKGKPAPDCFLAAARALGVRPDECLVIEESRHGIEAALAAGMQVVAVRAGCYPGQDQSAAPRIVDTLDDIDDAFVQGVE